ncbi:hypothetical protein MUP79_08385 [Candidatus Bathyarchaeota archaeon]|nr:hypothetical protein [Candidatus Bathyarchaeota archaeon]
MQGRQLAQSFAPRVSFSKGERYFPCSVFFAGTDILRNKEAYDALDENEKKRLMSCYYHVVEDDAYAAYQYWYYYTYNDYSGGWTGYLPDRHDHDMEFAVVYVNKSSGTPAAVALNQHHWLNWVWNPNLEMPIFAEEGGHGMFRSKRLLDTWEEGGLSERVEPKDSVESLRQRFINPEPAQLIDEDGTIKGKSANFIGMWAKPRVPWARIREYVLPISKLFYELEELKQRLLSRAVHVAYAYTPAELTLSMPYDKPTMQENLEEALRLQLITKEQYEALI